MAPETAGSAGQDRIPTTAASKRVLDVFADTLRDETALSEWAISRIADKLLIGLAGAGWRFTDGD